jgi:hypothetical protein
MKLSSASLFAAVVLLQPLRGAQPKPECPGFICAGTVLDRELGAAWRQAPVQLRAAHLVRLAESLPPGGAIHLPEDMPCGELDFRGVADDVQITGGCGGDLILGGGQQGMQMLFSRLRLRVEPGRNRDLSKRRPVQLAASQFSDFSLLEEKGSPLSGLLAMFCEGSIQVKQDVKNCAWICGANAFGMRTVTADARIDDSLFLWFGINWPFQDYNGHLDPKKAGRDWMDHAQMHLNLHGGGQGTRLYVMVETNYGNPGPGVVIENARGLALYQGTTERASSQGPGVYLLKNCESVQLGLRGINAFARTDHYFRCAMPAHDITIDGGRGNILHGVRFWGHAVDESIVNSDPALQVWACSFQYETKGLDAPGVVRFAVNPGDQIPDKNWLAAQQPKFAAYADWQINEWRKLFKVAAGDPAEAPLREKYLARFAKGRFHDTPMTAEREQTLVVAGIDCTKEKADLPPVPPPPAVPATDAPRLERPLAFTQAPEFGKALLDAGADPSGTRPSDDAFAKIMFGVSRDEVAKWFADGDRLDADFRKARAAKDKDGMDKAQKEIAALMGKFHPEVVTKDEKGKEKREKAPRGRIEVPPGRFRLTKPLPMLTWTTLLGAGPEKTTLFTGDASIDVIRRLGQTGGGTIGNLTISGGRAGLVFLGADHHDPVSPTRHSYVAGANVFNIHFRDQSFTGIWVGNDQPDTMGGSEHDQDKYVQLTFENTGDYGIYMNQNMLDKWLCLNSTFRGQKKAGVRLKFNNVIKGAVIGCRFENIGGPGFDCFGGNPEISYTPSLLFMDQCQFVECGSATEPALDMGHATLSALCHTKIETRSREIACGVRSAAQIYDEVDVQVKVPSGAPAVQMRAVRDISTARANGHTVRKFTSSGPLAFLNDSNARLEMYDATMKKVIASAKERQALGHDVPTPGPIDFDRNPLQHERPPANGWNNPFLFHQCRFAEQKMDLELLNADTARGTAARSVTLKAAK